MTRITRIKAKDIMQADVVLLNAATPIAEAIGTLEELEITGAPVVDSVGRLVGVLSSRDVTRKEHVREGRIAPGHGEFAMGEPFDEAGDEDTGEDVIYGKDDYSPAVLGDDTVADWMSPRVVSVEPEATLREVCRTMLAEHVHRVVVAKDGKVQGILSTFDVVGVVARAD